MSKNTSVSLGEHFAQFVDAQVASGRYASTSEVMRAALRLLEEREDKLTRLRVLIREGDESGPPVPFDFDAFIAEMHAEAEQGA